MQVEARARVTSVRQETLLFGGLLNIWLHINRTREKGKMMENDAAGSEPSSFIRRDYGETSVDCV